MSRQSQEKGCTRDIEAPWERGKESEGLPLSRSQQGSDGETSRVREPAAPLPELSSWSSLLNRGYADSPLDGLRPSSAQHSLVEEIAHGRNPPKNFAR
jgi:hypothetical protein